MAALQAIGSQHLLHVFVTLLFDFLILCLFIRVILSWLLSFLPSVSPSNPFVRFFTNITGPIYDPVYRVLPRMSISMLDLRATITLIFSWWALMVLEGLLLSSLPLTW